MCIRIGEKVIMSYLFEIRRVILMVKYLDVGINVVCIVKKRKFIVENVLNNDLVVCNKFK